MRKFIIALLCAFLFICGSYLGYKHIVPAYSFSEADYPKHDLESMEMKLI